MKSPDLVKKTELVEAWQHFGIRVQTAIEDVITVENETDRYNNRYGSELENMSFELVSDVEQTIDSDGAELRDKKCPS